MNAAVWSATRYRTGKRVVWVEYFWINLTGEVLEVCAANNGDLLWLQRLWIGQTFHHVGQIILIGCWFPDGFPLCLLCAWCLIESQCGCILAYRIGECVLCDFLMEAPCHHLLPLPPVSAVTVSNHSMGFVLVKQGTFLWWRPPPVCACVFVRSCGGSMLAPYGASKSALSRSCCTALYWRIFFCFLSQTHIVSVPVRQPCNGLKRDTKQMIFQLVASLMLTGHVMPGKHKRKSMKRINSWRWDFIYGKEVIRHWKFIIEMT